MPNDYIPGTFDSSVHLILSTETNTYRLYFNSAISLDDVPTDYRPNYSMTRETFIPNARVSVNDFLFTEIINKPEKRYTDSVNYYIKYPDNYYELQKVEFIQPGNEYNLSITTEKGIITGKTRVPMPVTFTSHKKESNMNYTGGTINVQACWKRNPDASGYIYSVAYPVIPYIIDGIIYYDDFVSTPRITHDTCFTFKITSDRITKENNKYTIKVWTFDENYENYYQKAKKSSGINGAYGVFASMAMDSIVINVIKK